MSAQRAHAGLRLQAPRAGPAGDGDTGQVPAAVNLIVTFLRDGVRQCRAASRIAFDGKGGMIVYGSRRNQERLALSRIGCLRIETVQGNIPWDT